MQTAVNQLTVVSFYAAMSLSSALDHVHDRLCDIHCSPSFLHDDSFDVSMAGWDCWRWRWWESVASLVEAGAWLERCVWPWVDWCGAGRAARCGWAGRRARWTTSRGWRAAELCTSRSAVSSSVQIASSCARLGPAYAVVMDVAVNCPRQSDCRFRSSLALHYFASFLAATITTTKSESNMPIQPL